jgi:hypothetical protein
MKDWITLPELAEISSVSAQRLRTVIRRNTPWRGADLVVRHVPGRGGRSGMVYEVRIDNLPLDLQERLKAHQGVFEPASSHGAKAQSERTW